MVWPASIPPSAVLTGIPTAATAPYGTDTTQLATTEFVQDTIGGFGVGTVTKVSVVAANGFDGTVATDTTTPAITLKTSIIGLLQGDGTAISAAAVQGTGDVVLKSYADGLVTGLLDLRGTYDASGNVWPSAGGSGTAGAILKGDTWFISVGGTLPTGVVVVPGDSIIANTNTPGQTQANWNALETNIGYVAENAANKNASGGYVGLSGYAIQIKNAAATFTSTIANTNTVARAYTLPNKDGTFAMTDDLPAAVVYTARTANQTQAANEGTVANKAGTACVVTLPTTAAVGTVQGVAGLGATGWKIAVASGQIVHYGDLDSISTGGVVLASTNRYDCAELMCVVADTAWVVRSSQGNIAVTIS